jgi:hypothetical protein
LKFKSKLKLKKKQVVAQPPSPESDKVENIESSEAEEIPNIFGMTPSKSKPTQI